MPAAGLIEKDSEMCRLLEGNTHTHTRIHGRTHTHTCGGREEEIVTEEKEWKAMEGVLEVYEHWL